MNIIPERVTCPAWLNTPGSADEEQIRADLIAIHFWTIVDERSKAKALAKVKKEKDWIITQPVEAQTPELQQKYDELLSTAVNDLISKAQDDKYVFSRLEAQAADMAFDKTSDLETGMERAGISTLLYINEHGYLSYLEADNIEQYMLGKIPPGSENEPIYREKAFMATHLVPIFEANGYSRRLILGIELNFHKARYAIPYLKEVLGDILKKTDEIRSTMVGADEEEKIQLDKALTEAMKMDDRLHQMLDLLIQEMSIQKKQGGLSAAEFKNKLKVIRGKRQAEITKMLGYCYNIGKGGVLMISVDDPVTLGAIKNLTSQLVDWHLGSPEDLARESARRLLLTTQPQDLRKIHENNARSSVSVPVSKA
jgi:hypothetical protein